MRHHHHHHYIRSREPLTPAARAFYKRVARLILVPLFVACFVIEAVRALLPTASTDPYIMTCVARSHPLWACVSVNRAVNGDFRF